MWHHYAPGDSIARTWRLRERLIQFFAMSGSSAIDRDYVDRPGALRGIVQTHGFGELGPCGPTDKSVSVPCAESAGSVGWWIPCGIDRGFGSEMLDDGIIPILPI